MGSGVADSRHVTLGQVYHMDIVPDAGAVVGVIVIAEYAQSFPSAHGHLGDIGHQIVGNALGILTDEAAVMGADGIKVPQQHHGPRLIRKGNVPKDLLTHILGPAVGIRAIAGTGGLPQGHFIVPGIDGSRGGEDNPFYIMRCHHPAQGQCGAKIVGIVFFGDGYGLAHRLHTGKMDNAVNGVLVKDLGQGFFVAHIQLIEQGPLAGDGLHPVQHLRVGVCQVVNDDNLHT